MIKVSQFQLFTSCHKQRCLFSFISSIHILGSPSREAQKLRAKKKEFQLRSVDDEEIVIAWVNENECL